MPGPALSPSRVVTPRLCSRVGPFRGTDEGPAQPRCALPAALQPEPGLGPGPAQPWGELSPARREPGSAAASAALTRGARASRDVARRYLPSSRVVMPTRRRAALIAFTAAPS